MDLILYTVTSVFKSREEAENTAEVIKEKAEESLDKQLEQQSLYLEESKKVIRDKNIPDDKKDDRIRELDNIYDKKLRKIWDWLVGQTKDLSVRDIRHEIVPFTYENALVIVFKSENIHLVELFNDFLERYDAKYFTYSTIKKS